MEITITTLGAISALLIAIILIFLKIPAPYSLMLGALVGGLIGGGDISSTISLMTTGAGSMMTTVLRILAAGVLAGTLIKSNAAESIAKAIIDLLGEKMALLSLSIATMILTAVGVFVDIAVITVAPVALAIAHRLNISKRAILLAMIGGGKAGNIMSPNPNAIAISSTFNQPLTSVMMAGIIPAIFGLLITYVLARTLQNKGSKVTYAELDLENIGKNLPDFKIAILAPLVAIILLVLRPIFGINIDPMLALPLGGLVGSLFMGKLHKFLSYINYGLNSMINVAIILIGTGTLAGIIQNSNLGEDIIGLIQNLGMPLFMLAPISGILMSASTASTTSGSTVAAEVFGPTLMKSNVSNLASATMTHIGATVLDHLPHGSFFHATGGSVKMVFKERIKLIGYESLVGLTMTIVSTILYGVLGLL